MTTEPTDDEIEAAARALADPYGHAPESFRPAVSAHIAAGRALAAALPLVEARLREQIAGEIEALRARHFAQHGNEETGPRNYDWGLTHAANLARTGYPLGHALDGD